MDMSTRTALYRWFGAAGDLLYVGRSRNPVCRADEHAQAAAWWQEVASSTVTWFDTLAEAMRAEGDSIATEHPRYNSIGRRISAQALEGTDLEALGRARSDAKVVLDESLALLKAAVLEALANGASEMSVARQSGLDRMTVRQWQGKSRRRSPVDR